MASRKQERYIRIKYYFHRKLAGTHDTTDEWDAEERRNWNNWLNDPGVSAPGAPGQWDEFALVPYSRENNPHKRRPKGGLPVGRFIKVKAIRRKNGRVDLYRA